MIRLLISLEWLSIEEAESRVCYQYDKESSELERMDYLEFIARVTSHIPDKAQVMIRYYGLYATMPTPSSTCSAGTLDGIRDIFFINVRILILASVVLIVIQKIRQSIHKRNISLYTQFS